jgi:glycosyltransferase involved in cell wall biosynthesis
MRVFIIPSWYPSYSQPLAGIFTQEQAEAIADLASDIFVIVSKWGHSDGYFSPRSFKKTFKAIYWRSLQSQNCISEKNKVQEIFNPVLTFPFCGIERLVNVNRKNIDLAIKKFGEIDVIHAHVSYPAGYIASVLSKEFNVPYIITEHMGPFPFLSLMRKGKPIQEIDQAFSGATKTIAVSPALARQIASFGFAEPVVVPNLVDERLFIPGEPASGKFIFFTLCGISKGKGLDQLLKAIAWWNPSPEQFEFCIGGDGPMKPHYERMVEKLGLADRVRWLGSVSRDAAPELFRQCHAYVMPSRHETFGVVYAEAIASGKPVIATRCGGPEFIVNDLNGMLVDVGDIEGLAEAMKKMSAEWHRYDPVMIREDFIRRFSRRAVVSQLEKIYRDVAGVN